MFDVTMGSYERVEACILIGTYLLSLLPQRLIKTIGLYRDDGLAACNASPQTIDKLKKDICTIFNKQGLKITIDTNKKVHKFHKVVI
jgi:hypothetical protein